MPQGIEVYDGNGKLIFDSSNNLARHLITFTTGTGAGSRSVPGLSRGRPWVVVYPIFNSSPLFYGAPVPVVSFNQLNETVSWPSVSTTGVTGYIFTIMTT